jgi:hypothetical protein
VTDIQIVFGSGCFFIKRAVVSASKTVCIFPLLRECGSHLATRMSDSSTEHGDFVTFPHSRDTVAVRKLHHNPEGGLVLKLIF